MEAAAAETVDGEMSVCRDGRLLRRVAGVLARKPGAALVVLSLGCVLTLPLLVHYLLALGVAGLGAAGLLGPAQGRALGWLLSRAQLLAVALLLAVAALLMLLCYCGIRNTFTHYFRTHTQPHTKQQ